jgi:hypothetical protein
MTMGAAVAKPARAEMIPTSADTIGTPTMLEGIDSESVWGN